MATAASTPIALSVKSRSSIEYWHLLNLDAPTVAVTWACALCAAVHVAVPLPLVVLLVLGTWVVYTADRIFDGIRPFDSHQLRERHHFHRDHRRAFMLAGVAVLIALVWLVVRCLSGRLLRDCLLVLAATLAYFAVVHLGGVAAAQWFPKELAVGIIFAAAVALPAWSQLPPNVWRSSFIAVAGLLSALFWLNCLAIETWESAPGRHFVASREGTPRDPWRLQVWPGWARFGAIGIMVVAAFFLAESLRSGNSAISVPFCFSIALSAALLLCLERVRIKIPLLGLRIGADLALLTPVISFAFSRVLRSASSLMNSGFW